MLFFNWDSFVIGFALFIYFLPQIIQVIEKRNAVSARRLRPNKTTQQQKYRDGGLSPSNG